MKILIAEDDATSQLLLQSTLEQWDHEVVVTSDGLQAYQALLADDAPRLAIFDWMMPHLDGVDICRKARKEARLRAPLRHHVNHPRHQERHRRSALRRRRRLPQ